MADTLGLNGYDAGTILRMLASQPANEVLAPDPNAEYGNILPVAKDRATGAVRPAMPAAVRSGLQGIVDLGEATQTGSLTGDALASLTLGGLLSGLGLAPRGAIAAGGAPIRAYHGSPHSFEKFDLSGNRLRTGEGGNAYGAGTYFAENEAVARSYRDALSAPTGATPQDVVGRAWAGNAEDTINILEQRIAGLDMRRRTNPSSVPAGSLEPGSSSLEQALELVKSGYRPGGSMYEVNIHADPQRFINWDKPLSQQPQVSEALGLRPSRQYSGLDPTLYSDALKIWLKDRPDLPANRVMNLTNEATAKALQEAGVPGVRYLDAGSRGKGQGTSNYVVFPTKDEIVEILRKYGLLGPSPIGLPNSMLPPEEKVY